MENKLIGLLVGMHFNPPAKALMQGLPNGAKLRLVPEPENPYDENAVRVLVASESVVPGETLEGALAEMGHSIEEVLAQPEWPLGHLAASGGKPLGKANIKELVGTIEFLAAKPEKGEPWFAELRRSVSGLPLVIYDSRHMYSVGLGDEADETGNRADLAD